MDEADRFMPAVRWGLHIVGLRVDSYPIEPKWKGTAHKAIMMTLFVLNLIFDLAGLLRCKGHLACTVDNVATTTLQILGIWMLLAFIKKESTATWVLEEIPRMMREFKTEEETRKVDRLCNILSKMYNVYVCFGTLSYCLYPVMDYRKCLQRDNSHSAYDCGE